jgi:hypothetical protein
MSDALSLRSLLSRTDGSAPAIQSAAGAMMKHYAKSAGVAVVEWRNALHQARQDQHLPLLYVANEVLQNSKRNRGNKFLEAFSPILGQSLIYICQNNTSAVEKVRRTVKIWADRRVFTVRYVNELLTGMDPYRNGESAPPPVRRTSSGGSRASPSAQAASNSPKHKKALASPIPDGAITSPKETPLENDDAESDDDGDLFGDANDRILDIEIDLDKAAASASARGTSESNQQYLTNARKRRRNNANSATSPKVQRRRSVLSTNSLMDLWNKVSTLQDKYDHCQSIISSIDSSYLDESSVMEQIDTLVGDELLQQYKQTLAYEKRVVEQRRELHNIGQQRRTLELESIRYLPWLEGALKQDQDDAAFCKTLEKQVDAVKHVHGLAKAARTTRLEEEAKRQQEKEALATKKAEEIERKRFMKAATAKVTVAQPGMVWNKATGEYQYRDTDESWRD